MIYFDLPPTSKSRKAFPALVTPVVTAVVTVICGAILSAAVAYVAYAQRMHDFFDDRRFIALESNVAKIVQSIESADHEQAQIAARQERVLQDLRDLRVEVQTLRDRLATKENK